MPRQGRPRLTDEDLQARTTAYCGRYGVSAAKDGLPPFPAGKRETAQHREWISLYKLHSRLQRRARGVCERCSEPAVEGSIFCEAHHAESGAPRGSASAPDERRAPPSDQDGRCPVCARKLEARAAARAGSESQPQALLHASCDRLARLAAALGPEGLDRLRAYLWPRAPKIRT